MEESREVSVEIMEIISVRFSLPEEIPGGIFRVILLELLERFLNEYREVISEEKPGYSLNEF